MPDSAQDKKQKLTVGKAAKLLGVSAATLRRYEENGLIQSKRADNGYRIFQRESVINLKNRLEEEAAREEARKKAEEAKAQAQAQAQAQVQVQTQTQAQRQQKTQIQVRTPKKGQKPQTNDSTQLLPEQQLFRQTINRTIAAYATAAVSLLLIFTYLILPWKAKVKINEPAAQALNKGVNQAGTKFAQVLGAKWQETNTPIASSKEPSTKKTLAANVLGRRTRTPDFELDISVPTIIRDNFTAEGLATLSGGIVTNNEDIDAGTGGITAGPITAETLTADSLTFTGDARLNNLLIIDDTTQETLEETLELTGDITGTLDDNAVESLGGANVGDIDSGELLILDRDEITGGSLTDLDTTAITELGTITTGTWTGTTVATGYGGTGLTSYVKGDIVYASADNTLKQLNIGSEGRILTATGGIPAWTDVDSALGGDVFLTGGNSFDAPAILGTNDTYSLSFETNDITRAYITSSGNMGIGNTNPGTKLHLGDKSSDPTYVTGETESMFIEGNLEVTGTIYGGAIIGPTSYDEGSVTFIGTDGYVDQNNSQFYWNDTSERLGIGTSSPDYKLEVVGTVGIDGDMTFVEEQTIQGTGTLTINPTGNLYFQSDSYYIDESGSLTVAKANTEKIEYSGNITINADSSTNTTTVSVTNEDATQVANLQVEGDVDITGGKITLANGETIDAETSDTLSFQSDGNIRAILGDNTGSKQLQVYDSTGVTQVAYIDSKGNINTEGTANFAKTLTVESGGADITGDTSITGTLTATEDLIVTNQLRVGTATNTTYNYIADDLSSATASMNTDTDLFIEGDLQIGGILIAPATGEFGYWTRTGTTLSPTTTGDDITTTGTITGNTLTDNTLSINSGNLTTTGDLEASTGTITTLDGTTTTYDTANLTTIDLGTNTITDGSFTGNWNFNSGNISSAGNITAEGTTGLTLSGTGADLYIGAVGLDDNTTADSGASLIGLYDNSLDNITSNTTVQIAIENLDSTIGSRTYTEQNDITNAQSVTTSLDNLDMALTDVETGVTGMWRDDNTNNFIYASNYTDFVITDEGKVGIGTTSPDYKLQIGGAISATQTITSYDNVFTVDRNGGGDYTTITQAISAINTAGDAASDNPYVIIVMAGTYDEDVTLPNYVSLKGQGWKATTIDGRITVGDGSYIQDLFIYPTGAETIAVITDPDSATSYMSNVYAVINTSTDASTYLLRHTGDTDFRIGSSFLYARNPNTGASAKTYNLHSTNASGDLEVWDSHAKTSCPNNSNCVLALNDSSAAGADIIFAGNWAVFNDTSPLAADNNNANGQIKLSMAYENDNSDYAAYTTEGSDIVINPLQSDKLAINPGTGLTSGNLLDISYNTANTLSGTLTGLNLDLSTNVTDGDNAIIGLDLNLPDSGTATSKALNIQGSPDFGFYVEGETDNYLSGNLGIGTTSPDYTLDVQGDIGILNGSDLYTYSTTEGTYNATLGTREYTEQNYVTSGQTLTGSIDELDKQLQDLTSGSAGLWQDSGTITYLDDTTDDLAIGGTGPTANLYFDTSASALTLNPYGASSGGTGELRLTELSANGTGYTGLKAPDSLDSNIMYTLPNAEAGGTDYVLTYQTGGALEWKDVTGVGGAGDITNVGSITSGAAFSDGNSDDDWLGLGASTGRIEFDDQGTDEVNILDANVGIGTPTPTTLLDIAGNANITGNITISGTVDGRDISDDGAQLDELYSDADGGIGLSDLASAEVDQLENIDSTTVSAIQWDYLGSTDQGLATTDAVTFATINTGQGANELYAMNQDVETTDEVTFADLTLTTPTANRLVATDGTRKLVHTSISDWLTGTANQITVTDDTDGTATLALPQSIHTSADVTFGSLTLGTSTQVSSVLDEDTLSSNSDTALATQQSIKAYTDSKAATQDEISELDDVSVSSAVDGHLLIYDADNVSGAGWYNKAMSGDATIADTGTITFADNTIDDAELVNALTYSGTLNLTGTWQIDSSQVTATAAELNILDNATLTTTQLNYLDGATVTTGGVMFADGTKITENADKFYWNNSNYRLGIGTTAPNYTLDVNGDIQIANGFELYSFGSATLGNRSYAAPQYVTSGETFTASIQALDDQVYDLSQGNTGLWLDQTSYIQASNYTDFVIEDAGYVGIGTTDPDDKLDVVGNIGLTGTLSNGTVTLDTANLTSTGGLDVDLGDAAGSNAFDIRDSDDSNLFTIDSNGNLSLSGASASFSLDNGANTALMVTNSGTGDSFRVNDVSGDTTPFVVDADGNVGIGTTNPNHTLEVAGDFYASGAFYDSSEVAGSSGEYLQSTGTGTSWTSLSEGTELLPTGTEGQMLYNNAGTWTAFDNMYWDDTNSRLGLGTTNPSTLLHLEGTTEQLRLGYDATNYTSFTTSETGQLTLADSGTDIVSFNESAAKFSVPTAFTASGDVSIYNDLAFTNETASYITSDASLYMQAGDVGGAANLYLASAGSGAVVVNDDLYVTEDLLMTGNVLAANGSAAAPSLSFEGDDDTGFFSAASNTELGLAVGGSEVVRVNGSGNMGVGTTAPDYTLDIAGNLGLDQYIYHNDDADTFLNFTDDALALSVGNEAFLTITEDDTQDIFEVGDDGDIDIKLSAGADGALFVQGSSGHVGIGDTDPSYILTVDHNGDGTNVAYVNSSNAWTNGSADYAEYFYTEDTDLEAGEAVCLDITTNNQVVRCENMADSNVIGIISTSPAFLGNAPAEEAREDDPHWKMVAMLGQIPAKASTENGEIRPGDLLAAGSVPGTVMKANAGDSTVGVALERLGDGEGSEASDEAREGEILVMISRKNKSLTVAQVEDKITDRIAAMEIEDEVDLLVADALAELDAENLNTRMAAAELNIDSLGTNLDTLNNSLGELDTKVSDLENLIAEITETTESTESSPTEESPTKILAEVEAVFAEFKEFVYALGLSVDEETETLVSESNFTALGDTTLADTFITGDLAVGLLEIDSMNNAINVSGSSCYSDATGEMNDEVCQDQTLHLQKNLAGNINAFDGKIIITPKGDIEITGTVKARKYEVEMQKSGVTGASAGRAIIEAGQTVLEVVVDEGVLTENSMIMVTPERPVAIGSKQITKDAQGNAIENTFEIRLSAVEAEDLAVSWWIIN